MKKYVEALRRRHEGSRKTKPGVLNTFTHLTRCVVRGIIGRGEIQLLT